MMRDTPRLTVTQWLAQAEQLSPDAQMILAEVVLLRARGRPVSERTADYLARVEAHMAAKRTH